nr:matrix metalloproteinase-2-like [Penaeus vannamei]
MFQAYQFGFWGRFKATVARCPVRDDEARRFVSDKDSAARPGRPCVVFLYRKRRYSPHLARSPSAKGISCSVSNPTVGEDLSTTYEAHLTTTETSTLAPERSSPQSAPRNATSGVPGVRFCGVPDDPDIFNRTRGQRVKRYNAQGRKWNKKTLTWTLRRSSSRADLPEGVIRQQLTAAMHVWERESTLIFQEVHKDTKDVDIIVSFETGDHGDGYKFDGQGGTLAHAFYPGGGIGGDMHFDDTEKFVTHLEAKKYVSNSLLVTAAHELGHSLGLLHSDVSTALMAPFYQEFPPDFRLPTTTGTASKPSTGPRSSYRLLLSSPSSHLQAPYIPPRAVSTRPPLPHALPKAYRLQQGPVPYDPPTPHTPEPPSQPCPIEPPEPGVPDTCSTEYDTATVYRGDLYFFKDKYYWRVDRRGMPSMREFPYKIKSRFYGLPRGVDRIDGVYEDRQDHLVFFSGPNYFVLDHFFRLRRKGVISDLRVNATHIDAVMVWGHNGRTYLFSGNNYWRLDRQGMAEMDYPRDVNVWRGLPHNMSAAFTFHSVTYFLAGRVYWQFNNTAMRAVRSPYLTASHWLSCPFHDLSQATRCSSRSPASLAPTPAVTATLALLAAALCVGPE